MTFLRSLLSIILVLGVLHSTISVNYCDKSLCDPDKTHVACNNDGKFTKQCSADAKVVPMTKELQNLIVKKHNELRNKFAQGFDRFSPAARIGTMQWNEELAKLADLNIKRCDGDHDDCLSTPTFPMAGQSIAQLEYVKQSVEESVNIGIEDWFSEYPTASMADMKSFPEDQELSFNIGHFTAVVQENSVHVGCAILRQTNLDGLEEQTTTCNYGYGNVPGEAVYTPGKAASKCKTGPNPNYKNLCSVKELYEYK